MSRLFQQCGSPSWFVPLRRRLNSAFSVGEIFEVQVYPVRTNLSRLSLFAAMYPDPQQYAAYGLLPDFANFHIGQPQQPGHSTGQPSQPIQQLGAQQPGFQQQSGHPSGFQGGQVDQLQTQQVRIALFAKSSR